LSLQSRGRDVDGRRKEEEEMMKGGKRWKIVGVGVRRGARFGRSCPTFCRNRFALLLGCIGFCRQPQIGDFEVIK
jgi:hypothetical protein